MRASKHIDRALLGENRVILADRSWPLFCDITTERLRRDVFTSVSELVKAIDEYFPHHNKEPKAFIWTKSARDLRQKVIRANSRLSSRQKATLDAPPRPWSATDCPGKRAVA